MPIPVSAKSGRSHEPAPEGVTQAVCVDVIDLGKRPTKWGEKQQVKFVFETPHRDSQGRPIYVHSFPYSASLSEKANLRKDLERWRNRPFTPEELTYFDLETVIGASAILMITHKTSPDGTVFANIGGLFKDTNKDRYASAGGYVRVKDRPKEGSAPVEHHDEPDDDDEVPF